MSSSFYHDYSCYGKVVHKNFGILLLCQQPLISSETSKENTNSGAAIAQTSMFLIDKVKSYDKAKDKSVKLSFQINFLMMSI